MPMGKFADRIAGLSPEVRARLEAELMKRAKAAADRKAIPR